MGSRGRETVDRYATSRKVAVRIRIKSFFFFFNLPNRFSLDMALAFTEPLTEISTRKCFWGVQYIYEATNLKWDSHHPRTL
jgi:hypothetical protein